MHVLLTGMSGAGKSSVIDVLAARGYAAVDVDDAGWTRTGPDGHPLWDEPRVQGFLDDHAGEVAVLSGCADNQVRFYPRFDRIVLLSAPAGCSCTAWRRARTTPTATPRPSGPRCWATSRRWSRSCGASHEIVTTAPLAAVVAEVLRATIGANS